MKAKNRNNLRRLILVHLLLLAYPLMSKTFHVHHNERVPHEISNVLSFDQPEDFCPVCDFEFYNFISSPVTFSFVAQQIQSANNLAAPQKVFIQPLEYFSLRAPPVA